MDKRYDHIASEQQTQQLWQSENSYSPENNPGPLYSIDTPPPTVSGALHIGHIFSYTQTDIIARYKRMSGYSVFYPFGFDDNGLATERFVEKKRDIRAHELKRSDFIAICLEETKIAQQQFKQLWQKIGLSVDWNSTYSTISDSVRKLSQESFILLYKKGHIYRKQEPALYCTTCRTSVAQAELDDAEKPSFFNTIAFKLEDGTELLVGTTRPELLSSCVALFYHPDDTRYQYLKGKQARVPVFNNYVPIYADDQVQIDKGTGLVMCCTFGDKTDIHWFKTHNLPYKQSIGIDGIWLPQTGILAGLKGPQARETILKALEQEGLLKEKKPIMHSVNVHERCKKEIEYMVLSQWFMHILEHKKKFLELADTIAWYPAFMKSRYNNWVENLSWDWCLSRQRFYGIPFPAWHCQQCSEIIIADTNTLPIDPQETPYKGACPRCGSAAIKPDTDVMDTWNTSSITPYICYELYNPTSTSVFEDAQRDNFLPMGMRPQAHDIIRTWAFYTIIKAWMHNNTIPWNTIVISGHVLSDSKEKISKSKDNNKLAPEALLAAYPADVIRYWTASGNLGHDVAFSDNQLKIGQRLITKLWNACKFIHEHKAQENYSTTVPHHLGAINEWILHQATICFKQYQKAFAEHEFSSALNHVETFFWQDVCDNYLELIKDQLFKPENYSPEAVAATRWTLATIGLRILQLYAPYLPHITETLYGILYKEKLSIASLHQTKFAETQREFEYPESTHILQQVLRVITDIRKLKTEKQLSLKVELATLKIVEASPEILAMIQQQEALIKGIAHAALITYASSHTGRSMLEQQDGAWHAVIVHEA